MGNPAVMSGRAVRPALGAAVLALVGFVVGCVDPPPPADPYALDHRLGDGALVLEWQTPTGGAPAGYEVQQSIGGSWVRIGTTAATSFPVEGLAPRERYSFRVRSAAGGGVAAGPWSRAIRAPYIEPELPVVRIDTDGAVPVVDKATRLPGSVSLDPNGSAYEAFSGRIEINGRGNSTWTMPKKPYRLRLAEATDVMGMGSNRHWVLLANAFDRSQLRTSIATQLGEVTDLEWTPQFRHVELVLNGKYQGVYQLGEHVRRGATRVDIERLQPGDTEEPRVTGGYLLEMNSRYANDGDPGFTTSRGARIEMKEPDPGIVEQETYIADYVQAFEDSLFASDWTDPTTGYRARLDLGSFIDHYWVRELVRDGDAYLNSTNFFKRRGGPLQFGPLWDFDRSMGGYRVEGSRPPDGWEARNRGPWLPRVFSDPAFVAQANQRWHQLRPGFVQVVEQIEAEGVALAAAVANDQFRWPSEGRVNNEPAFIRQWLEARVAWIDEQVGPPPETVPVVVNEVQSRDPAGGPDWVELLNLGAEPVDLTGYVLKDDNDSRTDTLSVVIPPGGFAVLTEGQDFAFGLGSNDEARLFEPDGVTLVDGVKWSDHPRTTWGRCPDGTGPLQENGAATPGAPNDCTPPTDPTPDPDATIRITEWMYSGAGDEFVELTNVGTEPVDLTGWSYDDDDATPGAFDLSPFGLVMPGESVVFVEATPESFRADWGLCSGVKIIGPYTNNLGRVDQINIFDQNDALVDVLTYGDSVIPGSPRTRDVSAWVTPEGLGADDATLWVLSAVGDAEGSWMSNGGDVGSPGQSTRATVAFDPCSTSG